MKKLIITIAIGAKIAPFYEQVSRPRFIKYAKKCKADFKELRTGVQTWWGMEKFRLGLPTHVKGYDKILFLDADVIVQDFAPSIFKHARKGKVGVQDDWDVNIQNGHTKWAQREFNLLMREQERPTYPVDRCLNTGVVLYGQDTVDIWNPPPNKFTLNHCAEQFWVDYQIGNRFYGLDRIWNNQYWQPEFNDTFQNANFVHLSAMTTNKKHKGDRVQWYEENKDKLDG